MEVADLPASGSLWLKMAEPEQREPVRVVLTGHQFMRTLAFEAQILRYHVEKWRYGTIARQLHLHRGTVQRVLAQAGLPRVGAVLRPSQIDAYLPFISDATRITALKVAFIFTLRFPPYTPRDERSVISGQARHLTGPRGRQYWLPGRRTGQRGQRSRRPKIG
jgi:hypothetical protein